MSTKKIILINFGITALTVAVILGVFFSIRSYGQNKFNDGARAAQIAIENNIINNVINGGSIELQLPDGRVIGLQPVELPVTSEGNE